MYKCTDCGLEYEIKPEYCDCGNNIFEEIKSQIQTEKNENISVESANNKLKQDINESSVCNNTTLYASAKKNADIPSVLIFTICIILSILSWIFIGNDSKKPIQEAQENKIQIQQNIPPIDKIWKENPIKLKPEKNQSEPIQQKEVVIKQVLPVYLPKKENTSQKITKQSNTTKKTNSAKPTPVKQIPTKTTNKTLPVQTYTPIQPITQTQSAQKVQQTNTKTEQKSQQTIQQSQVQTKPAVQIIQNNVNNATQQQELANYKVSLRNKIGNSINFLSVSGNGNCAITFRIDSVGNLIDRKFVIQSENNSLNNAVYKAMMSNPTFKAPPNAYKGETMTLSVKMNNGNYNVYLK